VLFKLGVVKEVLPESRMLPPVEAVNQSIVSPALADAVKVRVPAVQRLASVPVGVAGGLAQILLEKMPLP